MGKFALRSNLSLGGCSLFSSHVVLVSFVIPFHLVEVIFGYPGIGTMLYQAIRGSDFYLVQGIVFVVIVSIGLATFILDIVYPLLDPRITYRSE